MTELTPAQLAAIRARLAAATRPSNNETEHLENLRAKRVFRSTATADIAALLAEVERLRGELASWKLAMKTQVELTEDIINAS